MNAELLRSVWYSGGGGAYCFLRYTFLVLGNDSDVMI